MRAETNKLQVPKAICVGLIGIAWAVAIINVIVNIRNGSRLSVDDSGMVLNGAIVGALSFGPALLASTSGYLWSGRRWGWALLAGLLAIPLVAFNLWNASEFVGDQMLGRLKMHEDRVTSGKDIAEIKNNETLRSKRDTEAGLLRTYLTTKDPKEQARLKTELVEVRSATIELTAPGLDATPSMGARASWVAKRLGWDKETVEGITPLTVPILMQIVELFFSLLGFGLWPQPSNGNSGVFTSVQRKFTKAQAANDVVDLATKGTVVPSGIEMARRWNVSPATACNWLREFRKNGLIRRERNGSRLAIVRANGAHAGVS